MNCDYIEREFVDDPVTFCAFAAQLPRKTASAAPPGSVGEKRCIRA